MLQGWLELLDGMIGDGMLLANCTAAHVHLGVHHRSCSENRH